MIGETWMRTPTDSHQLLQLLVTTRSHFINKAIIPTDSYRDWIDSEHECVKFYGGNYFCECQGLDDFLHIQIQGIWCVCACVFLRCDQNAPEHSTCGTAGVILHEKNLLSVTENLSVTFNGTYFRILEEQTIICNIAPLSILAANCRSSLQTRTAIWLSGSQLCFIHGFFHMKMIHNSIFSQTHTACMESGTLPCKYLHS